MEEEKTAIEEQENAPLDAAASESFPAAVFRGNRVSVCDNQHDFAWFLDAVKFSREKRARFQLIDSGVFDRFQLEWLLEAGADLYTSDESRSDFSELEGLLQASRRGRALLVFFQYGVLEADKQEEAAEEEEEESSGLFDLANLGRGGAYLHVSNRAHTRDGSLLCSLAQSCRDGGSRLVYYHHDSLDPSLDELGRRGAWVHISDKSIRAEEDRMLLVELALSASSGRAGLVLHVENEMSFPLLDELQKAGAHILFKKQHIDFKSPLRKISENAAKKRLDFRAYYLHPTVLA